MPVGFAETLHVRYHTPEYWLKFVFDATSPNGPGPPHSRGF